MYRALIPVKALNEAKSRLAAHLTLQQREELVLTMLSHVLRVLHNSDKLEYVSVVSPDRRALEYAHLWGAYPRIEERQGHNPALEAAATRELATGATALLTISADLPLLQSSDVEGMIEKLEYHDVVLAPSQDETGTNALLVRPALVLPYVFGPGSLQRYQEEAAKRNLSVALHKTPGLSIDIDTIDDLELFRRYEQEERATCILCTIFTDRILAKCL